MQNQPIAGAILANCPSLSDDLVKRLWARASKLTMAEIIPQAHMLGGRQCFHMSAWLLPACGHVPGICTAMFFFFFVSRSFPRLFHSHTPRH
jgi:hypothetical protein